MAEGQTGEGMTAETQALSTENAQISTIFPSSVICSANATFPPQGGRLYTHSNSNLSNYPMTHKTRPRIIPGAGLS